MRLFFSFHYSRLSGKVVQRGLPFFVSIEPTTSCNLRCPQCPSGLRQFERETGMLNAPFFERALLQLKDHLHSLTFYFQGEPYLNPDFLQMVRKAADQRIFTITSTNAHYLDEVRAEQTVRSGLDKLIISVDGTDQSTYATYRVGGSLEKVMAGTEAVIRQKRRLKSSTPHVVWQFVVFSHNAHQIDEVKAIGKRIGVNEVKIKTAQIYDFEGGNAMIPSEKYSRYERSAGGRFRIKNQLLNKCWRMWQGCVITWDGKVVPCCFDKDAKHRLGDLSASSFSEIWHSPQYLRFRSQVMRSRKEIDICTNCTEGTKVWT